MQQRTGSLHLALVECTAPQTNQTTHFAQVKKVGDFTEDRVRGLVSALDRLDSKVKANRSGDERDELEQVSMCFCAELVHCACSVRMQTPFTESADTLVALKLHCVLLVPVPAKTTQQAQARGPACAGGAQAGR